MLKQDVGMKLLGLIIASAVIIVGIVSCLEYAQDHFGKESAMFVAFFAGMFSTLLGVFFGCGSTHD